MTASPELGATISARAVGVRFDDRLMWVDLDDGRTVGVPLVWYPRLLRGSSIEREGFEISQTGLHWDALDEDISIAGILAGRRDQTRRRPNAA